jgi:phosphatidylglycerophosphate synthase
MSLLGVAALLWMPAPWNFLLCAVGVQLRLICNLLDGMVAMEGGHKSACGALYNELPDRIADSLFIIALGYVIGVPWLGWCGALTAALTAYIRTLGGALGFAQDFRGPMAKQHRMAVLTIALLLNCVEFLWRGSLVSLNAAAWVIAIGSALTCITRTRAIAQQLKLKAAT